LDPLVAKGRAKSPKMRPSRWSSLPSVSQERTL
jgi:hypothetical protein